MNQAAKTRGGHLLEQVRAAYVQHGWTRFFAQQFGGEEFGTETEVVQAFIAMEQLGMVAITATLQCDNGHLVWSGPLGELQQNANRLCRECESPEDNSGDVLLRFDLTQQSQSEWGAEAQKKSAERYLSP